MENLRGLYLIIPLLAFALIWQLASTSGAVNGTLFPPPTEVFSSLLTLAASGELFTHINTSLWRVFLGLFLGGSLGILIGILTGRVRIVNISLNPILQVFRSFPPVALIPFIIVWLGIGDTAKLFSIGFAVFFPVWINTHVGASRIPLNYLHATATLTKSRVKKWFKVILPASLPFIVVGLRTAIGIAFIMVFVSELAGASSGLGYLISVSQAAYRMDLMMAGLIVLGFFGAFTDYAFVKLVRRIFPWMEKV